MKLRLLAPLVSLIAAPLTWAAAPEKPYSVHISAGWSSISFNTETFTNAGLTVDSLSKKTEGYGYGIAYQIDPMWSVEGNWNSLGYMTARGVSASGNWTANIHVENWTIGPAATFSLTDKISAVGRAGILTSDNQFGKSFVVKNILPDQQQSFDYYFGAGLKFMATPWAVLSLDVNYYHQLQRTTTVSGGFHFLF